MEKMCVCVVSLQLAHLGPWIGPKRVGLSDPRLRVEQARLRHHHGAHLGGLTEDKRQRARVDRTNPPLQPAHGPCVCVSRSCVLLTYHGIWHHGRRRGCREGHDRWSLEGRHRIRTRLSGLPEAPPGREPAHTLFSDSSTTGGSREVVCSWLGLTGLR